MDSKTRTYKFALKVISLVDSLPNNVSALIIGKQLLRAATSIGANVVEAQASPSRRDFTNYFNHALKSANETTYWLELLREANKGDMQIINVLIKETREIACILASSILTLKGKR